MYRNEGAMIAGAVFLPVGAGGFVPSLVLALGGRNACERQDDCGRFGGGVALMVLSGGMFLASFPLLIWGAPRIPVGSSPEGDVAAVTVDPVIGPTSGGVRVTF
jgi:hypothetical protein